MTNRCCPPPALPSEGSAEQLPDTPANLVGSGGGLDESLLKEPRIQQIISEEHSLRYPQTFSSADALALGSAAVRVSAEYGRGIAVSITRESDGLVIFQWMADDKTPRNLKFMEGKRLAALRCGHASTLAQIAHELDGSFEQMFSDDAPECPGPGAFPIRVGDKWVATISVSGLHEGKDHELVVRALSESILGMKI